MSGPPESSRCIGLRGFRSPFRSLVRSFVPSFFQRLRGNYGEDFVSVPPESRFLGLRGDILPFRSFIPLLHLRSLESSPTIDCEAEERCPNSTSGRDFSSGSCGLTRRGSWTTLGWRRRRMPTWWARASPPTAGCCPFASKRSCLSGLLPDAVPGVALSVPLVLHFFRTACTMLHAPCSVFGWKLGGDKVMAVSSRGR